MNDLRDDLRKFAETIDEYRPVSAEEALIRTRPSSRRRTPMLVASAGAVVVVALVGLVVALGLFRGESDPFVDGTETTLAPTTTVTVSTTTTVASTTTLASGPQAAFVWEQISDRSLAEGLVAFRVIHHNGGFLAVGSSDGDGALWRSTDGRAWTMITDPALGGNGDQDLTDVVPYGTGLVAVGDSGLDDDPRPLIAISADGQTWERVDTSDPETFPSSDPRGYVSFPPGMISSVAVHGDRLIMVGTQIWISDDARTWTIAKELSGNDFAYGVATGADGIVVVGQSFGANPSDAFVWWSADGDEWTKIPRSMLSPEGKNTFMLTVTATSDGFVAGGGASLDPGTSPTGGMAASDAALWVSPDGITWTLMPQDDLRGVNGEWITGLADAGDVLVAVGVEMNRTWNKAAGAVWESTDIGATWQRVEDPDTRFGSLLTGWTEITDVVFHNGTLISVGHVSEGYGSGTAAVWIGIVED